MKKTLLFIMIPALLAVCTAVLGAEFADYGKLTMDNVPSVKTIVKEAAAASTSGQDSIKNELKRIHRSNLLPSVRLQYGADRRPKYEYGYNTLTNIYDSATDGRDYTRIQTDYYNTDTGSQYLDDWYVDASWELNKLVVDREDLYLVEIKSRASYYQQNTMENVTDIYRDLVTLLYEKKEMGDSPSLTADIYAAAAELDFLTGNYLTGVIAGLPDEPVLKTEPAPAKVEAAPSAVVQKIKERKEEKKKQEEAGEDSEGGLTPFDMMLDE